MISSVWQRKMQTWLDKRIPPARRFQLDYRNIFIFLSRLGGLFLLLCLGLFLLGTNYQNNLMMILCYFLASLFLLNLFIAYLNFAKLDIQLGKVQNGFVDDQIQLPLWVNHSDESAHGLLFVHFWRVKDGIKLDLDELANPSYLALDCTKRGKLSLPRVSIESYFPLGLFRCWTHLKFQSDVLVYPRPTNCAINLFQQEENSQQASANLHHRGHDDFDSLSPYKQGEPLYHVAWKQVAKGQGLISKRFSHQTGASGWLVLSRMTDNSLETKLSKLCYQVIELSRQNAMFGLDLGTTRIPPDAGFEHQQKCLAALALYPEIGKR